MPSQNSREALKRQKLDFNERSNDNTGSYKIGGLISHSRPTEQQIVNRPIDTVKDRGATLPLDETEWGSSSSSSS
jgi:hypothetical protein